MKLNKNPKVRYLYKTQIKVGQTLFQSNGNDLVGFFQFGYCCHFLSLVFYRAMIWGQHWAKTDPVLYRIRFDQAHSPIVPQFKRSTQLF